MRIGITPLSLVSCH